MITETKTIYKCEHCRKLYQSKHFAEQHEKRCSKNPDNQRACFGCEHMTKRLAEVYMHSNTINLKLCYCAKKEMYLYPPIIEHKGKAAEVVDELNEPMPKTCPFFEDKEWL